MTPSICGLSRVTLNTPIGTAIISVMASSAWKYLYTHELCVQIVAGQAEPKAEMEKRCSMQVPSADSIGSPYMGSTFLEEHTLRKNYVGSKFQRPLLKLVLYVGQTSQSIGLNCGVRILSSHLIKSNKPRNQIPIPLS